MPQDSPMPMTQARFAAIVQAFGGNPDRWPLAEREAAGHWLAANPQGQALLSQAIHLDRVLGAGELPAVPAALERRLMDDFDRAQQRWSLGKLASAVAEAIWPGAPLWQPACALALAFAAGLCVAVFAPLDVPHEDDVSSNVFALDTVSDVDAGHGI